MRASQRAAHGAALLLVLGGAAAACPSAADLAGGVTFIAADGDLERHRSLGEDIIEVTRFDAAGPPSGDKAVLKHGLYFLSTTAGRVESRYEWQAGLEALPYPQLGLTEDLAVVVRQQGFSYPAVVSVSVGDTPGGLRLGDCTLEMWGIRTEGFLSDETGWGRFTQWFPALGTGVVVQVATNGVVTETNEYVGINW